MLIYTNKFVLYIIFFEENISEGIFIYVNCSNITKSNKI